VQDAKAELKALPGVGSSAVRRQNHNSDFLRWRSSMNIDLMQKHKMQTQTKQKIGGIEKIPSRQIKRIAAAMYNAANRNINIMVRRSSCSVHDLIGLAGFEKGITLDSA